MRFWLNKPHLLEYFIIIVALILSFSPALTMIYIYHDDVQFWLSPPTHDYFPNICHYIIYLGRYLGALILYLNFFLVDTPADLNRIHLISIALIITCALCSYKILLDYFKKPLNATLVALIIFSLPAFQAISCLTILCYVPYAILCAIGALYVAPKNFYIASLLMFMSHLIYPPAATFYWAMATFILFREVEPKDFSKKLREILLPGIMGIMMYAITFKIVGSFLHYKFVSHYQPQNMTTDVFSKFSWFLSTILPQVLNLWNIKGDNFIPLILGILIMGAGTMWLIQHRSWTRPAIIILFLFLSYLPNFLSALNINVYRCQIGLTTLFVFILISSLKQYLRFIPPIAQSHFFSVILCVACAWGLWQSYNNIAHARVIPSHQEYMTVRNAIKDSLGKMKSIYVIIPSASSQSTPHDEFVGLTSNYYADMVVFVNAILYDIASKEGLKWVYMDFNEQNSAEKIVFQDIKDPKKNFTVSLDVVISDAPPRIQLPETVILIDLRKEK